MAEKVVFALTNGRSGTLFLSGLIRRNARDCTAVHEPYLQAGNPTMFGRPIYDRAIGDTTATRKLVLAKRDTIRRDPAKIYVETSHAFLKSFSNIAPEYFPEMKLMHLIRDPLAVARSEANREMLIQRWRLPFRHYRGGDGNKYFRWALTGLEPIYADFDPARLTLFQRYVIQWIEIENRAMAFLSEFRLHASCLTLHTPQDLNDPNFPARLLRFLNVSQAGDTIRGGGLQNRNPGVRTVVTDAERREFRAIAESIPERYLAIFAEEPYRGRDWSALLKK